MRTRDIWMILVSLVIVIVSLNTQQDYVMELVMTIPIETSHYSNGHFPTIDERLPNPVISDLDGDGRNEIIYVTNDRYLRVVDIDDGMMSGGGVSSLDDIKLSRRNIKYEVSLISKMGVQSGRRPVALATGYPRKKQQIGMTNNNNVYNSNQQIIVVVTDEWGVLCFNHQLKPLWESFMVDEVEKGHYHSEVTIKVVPVDLNEGDEGLVIVGGRLEPIPNGYHTPHVIPAIGIDPKKYMDKDYLSDGDFTGYDPSKDDNNKGEGHGDHGHGDYEGDAGHHRDESHFSYYAMDARTGARRWSHEENDFKPQNRHADEELHGEKKHSYKQHVISITDHEGEVSWKVFKSYIFKHLPHTWSSNYDTKFDVAHFSRRSSQTDQGRLNSNTGTGGGKDSFNYGIESNKLFGDVFGGGGDQQQQQQQVINDQDTEPNVIVVHNRHGIEVIHMYTGRTLCKLLLEGTETSRQVQNDHYIVYADIDGDGVLDQVHALTGDPVGTSSIVRSSRNEVCVGMAMAGLPPRDHLFNTSICNGIGGLTDVGFFIWSASGLGVSSTGTGGENQRDSYQTVTPALIPSSNPLTPNRRDTVFLVSSGKISSVNSFGKSNWQIESAAKWKRNNFMRLFPTIQPFSIETNQFKQQLQSPQLLAIGQSIVIISSDDGSVLLDYNLAKAVSSPRVDAREYKKQRIEDEHQANLNNNNKNGRGNVLPTAPPIIGDLNNDGINDIIIPTTKEYYVLQISRGYSTVIFSLMSILVTLCILFLLFEKTRSYTSANSTSSSTSFGLSNSVSGGRMFKINKRSTD